MDRGSLPRDLLSTEPFIGPARHLAWGHRGRYLGRILFYTASHFSPRVLAQDSPSPEEPEGDDLYEVRIMDNDYNTYQQVMEITMLALGISQEEAFSVAWEVDHRGSCVVAVGALPEAEALAGLIRTIGIEVQVNPLIGGNA